MSHSLRQQPFRISSHEVPYRSVTLHNASGDTAISCMVDLEVRFGDILLTLEEVLVADVPFNAVSAAEVAPGGPAGSGAKQRALLHEAAAPRK